MHTAIILYVLRGIVLFKKIIICLAGIPILLVFVNMRIYDGGAQPDIEVGYSSRNPSLTKNQNLKIKFVKNIHDTSAADMQVVQPDVAGKPTILALDKNKVYTHQFVISHSNVTLDCNHATLDGTNNKNAAILVTGELLSGSQRLIKNIKIQNCIFKNYEHGVLVENVFRDTGVKNPLDPKIPNWYEYINSQPERIAERNSFRQMAADNVVISNCMFSAIRGHGVNVAPYSKNVRIERSSFIDNQIGIHLSQGSQGNKVVRSFFLRNGLRYHDYSQGPPPKNWLTSSFREAIAVDASSKNLISENIFQNSYGKSIATYKNCGEATGSNPAVKKDKPGKTREESADSNVISKNYFYQSESFYEKHKAKKFRAIEIASRQDKDTLILMCSDGYYFVENKETGENIYRSADERMVIKDKKGKFAIEDLVDVNGHMRDSVIAIARDYSKNNLISNNKFKNFDAGAIKIMDDNNTIKGNFFKKSIPGVITIGSKYRQLVNDPVINNTAINNCAGSQGKSTQLHFIGGSSKANNNIPLDKCSHQEFNLVKSK